MASRRVIVPRRADRELVVAFGFSGSDRIRSYTIRYRRLGHIVLAAGMMLLAAFYLLVVQATQAVDYADQDALERTRDPQVREFQNEFLDLIANAEELAQRQIWIQKALMVQRESAIPLEERENPAATLADLREHADAESFVGFRHATRRLLLHQTDLETTLGYGNFYQTYFHGLPHRSPLDKVSLRVSSGYGMRRRPFVGYSGSWEFHRGLDLPSKKGTTVFATARGRVVLARFSSTGYGNVIMLEHPQEYRTLYAHLSALFVRQGQHVRAGEPIGEVGTSGNSTGPHLHYEVRKSGHALNPQDMMAQ